jgi:hypothetical protein
MAVNEEKIMKYLSLVYVDEKKLEALSSSESDALDDEALAFDEELRKKRSLSRFECSPTGSDCHTIQIQNGKTFTTDGPFAETKEQLGGFILIDAKNLNEAIRVASKIPPGRLGCIEVRPIKELARTSSAGTPTVSKRGTFNQNQRYAA